MTSLIDVVKRLSICFTHHLMNLLCNLCAAHILYMEKVSFIMLICTVMLCCMQHMSGRVYGLDMYVCVYECDLLTLVSKIYCVGIFGIFTFNVLHDRQVKVNEVLTTHARMRMHVCECVSKQKNTSLNALRLLYKLWKKWFVDCTATALNNELACLYNIATYGITVSSIQICQNIAVQFIQFSI